jgi:Flp pilus assembly protein TadD
VAEQRRTRQKRLLREAEGYLELLSLFPEIWELHSANRDRLARRAIATLTCLEESDRQGSYPSYLRGQALRAMERYDEAIEPLRRAADEEPDNISIWLALGWCYKRILRLDLAIEALEEALAAAPREAIVYYNLACYSSLAGQTETALSYLATAFELDPRYRDLAGKERDFDPIRAHPSFRELTSVVA